MIEILGPIRQIAFLTRDIHASIAFYTGMGIGPWFYGDKAVFERLEYRGKPSAPELSYAVAAWGDLQLELMEPRGSGPSAIHDWIDRDYTSQLQHHVAVWPEDMEACLTEAQAHGFEIIQDGMTAAGRFIYLINPANPEFFLEITHATPPRRAFNQYVVDAAAGWDGSRPVRPFGVME